MVQVALADDMTFRLRGDGEVKITCEGLDVLAEENLAVKAARLLKQRAGSPLGLDIELRKSIPVGAGLGGGSSDAAATLAAANELWELRLDKADLAELGAELGSDVPFFLIARAGVCRGRGEKVEPIPSKAAPALVLASPGVNLSTREVYANVSTKDLTGSRRDASIAQRVLEAGDTEGLGAMAFNRLEAAAAKACPEIAELKAHLVDLGADGAAMSGSGSAVVGIFSNNHAARDAANDLKSSGHWVALTEFAKE